MTSETLLSDLTELAPDDLDEPVYSEDELEQFYRNARSLDRSVATMRARGSTSMSIILMMTGLSVALKDMVNEFCGSDENYVELQNRVDRGPIKRKRPTHGGTGTMQ